MMQSLLKRAYKYVNKYKFFIVLFFLSLNSFFIWYQYYKKNSNNKNLNFWFESKLEHNVNEAIDKSFGVSLFSFIETIRSNITKNISGESAILKDYSSPSVGDNKNFYNGESVDYNTGLFYKKGSGKFVRLADYKHNSKNTRTASIYHQFIVELKDKIGENDKIGPIEYSNHFINKFNISNISRNLSGIRVGRIYVACSDSSLVIYPRTSTVFDFYPQTRPWWGAAFRPDSIYSSTNTLPYDYEKPDHQSGLTPIYADVDNHNKTDLVRTYWYKFPDTDPNTKVSKNYLVGIDFFIAPLGESILYDFNNLGFDWSLRVEHLLFIIELLLLYLLFRYFKEAKAGTAVQNELSALYRLERYRKVFISDAGAESLELKIKSTKEVNEWNTYSFGVNWSPSHLPVKIDYLEGYDFRNSQGSEITLTKRFDLSLNSPFSTKAIEIWRMERINNPVDAGYFEVLWIQNTQEEVKISQIYWDSTLDLNKVKIQLKDHVLKSENSEFIYDPLRRDDSIDKVFESLKAIPPIAAFYVRANSFLKRKFEFEFDDDNIVEFIKKLYDSRITVNAVCSVEFLRKLIEINKFEQILNIPVTKRFIIETPERDLKKFITTEIGDNNIKSYLSLRPFQVKKITTSDSIVYNNRDFVIIEFSGEVKCVLITNISEGRVSSGWISWREVDVKYYLEIFYYLERLGGSTINDYMK